MKTKAIFLDRDGVLNHAIIKNGKPYSPESLAELTIPDDAAAALLKLKAAGFLLICVTNQPDVSRGILTRDIVEAINAKLMAVLPLDQILVCYHDDPDGCDCRKPLPGLLIQAEKQHSIDLAKSIMIGDRWKDIEAGQAVGCRTIWIKHDYQDKKPTNVDFIVSSLTEAVNWIVSIERDET